MNGNAPLVHVSDFGVVAYFTVYGDDIDAATAFAVRAAHDHVFASGKSASVETALAGSLCGVVGAEAIVRFL